jgi:hypothetical protein
LQGPSIERDWHHSAGFDDGASTWKRRTVRQVLIVLAFVVFQMTAGLAAGLTVAVFSFGIRDVRTALRLWKFDPNRDRGRVCSWFYLAYSCWCVMVAVVSLLFFFGLCNEDRRYHPSAPNLFSNEIAACAIILLFCMSVGIWASCIGVGLAMRRRIKVWVDPRLRLSLAANCWPPRATMGWPPILSGSSNRAYYIRLVFYSIVGFFLVLGLISLLFFFISWLKSEPFGILRLTALAVVLVPTVLLAWIVLSPSWRGRIEGIVASNPRECYPEIRSWT